MKAKAWAWWLGLLAAVAGARELDPATCVPRFHVQQDKIIRTEESREMGARYLSELDVGARYECLRLCCETDSCDVFVYEEKGPGSCYLFNCGPPEDFRCKFTAHSNFSSGVMAVSRRLAELQDQEQLARHEQALASLRSATSTTSSTTTRATSAPAPSQPHPVQAMPPRRCSRYQFECRHGGECIAVYNACDGVAQCADGSDEAPELGCPPPQVPSPPSPPSHGQPQPQPTTPTTTTAATPYKLLQESVEGGVVGDGLVAESPPLTDHWPHRLTQAQPQHRYIGGEVGPSSHIFSHKGGLLQEAEAPFAPFDAPWPRRPWSQPQGMEGMEGWAAGYPRTEWEADPRGGRAWPVPPPRPPPELPVYIPSKTMPEIPVVYSSQQQTLRDSAKKGLELDRPEATPPSPPPPPPPPVETTTHKKIVVNKTPDASNSDKARSEKKASAQAHQHYPLEDEHDHDGLSEHPPAAVLLLVMGVLMTAVMAAMLGCRMRAARRRLRRGKAPFAHDADYLVNGMYL